MKRFLVFVLSIIIVLSLLGCSRNSTVFSASSQPESSAPSVTYEEVALYVPNEDATDAVKRMVKIEENDEPLIELIEALIAEKALPHGTELKDYKISDDAAPKITLNFNDAFAEGISSQGTSGEQMVLASLINTVWEYFKPSSITIKVNDNPLETGHNIYEEPFTQPIYFR